jgi:LacI family transcriptional regulator
MGKVSILDVARDAGVSIATVSHVINSTKSVTPETTDRVLQSIEKLGYRINPVARSLKTGKSQQIAFIVPDISNAFFSTLIEEVELVLRSHGYSVLIANTKETEERELKNIELLSNSFVDGFLIASTMEEYTELAPFLPKDTPIVFIDRAWEECPHDTIVVSSKEALTKGVENLIAQGHQRIGYITGLRRVSTTQERLSAYTEVMTAHGLYSEQLIRVGDSMSPSVDANLEALLDAGCTAIVITNNVMATQAMTTLRRWGIFPGRDINILGYRDSEQAQYGLHNLDLVCQPTADLGRKAGELLLKRLKNPDTPPSKVVLNATLRLRKELN